MITKSIRWQIQAWHGALLVLITAVLLGGFYRYERRARFKAVDEELQQSFVPAVPALTANISPPPPGRPRPPHRSGEDLLLPFGGLLDFPEDEDRGRPSHGRREDARVANAEAFVSRLPGRAIFFAAWDINGELAAKSGNAPPDLTRPADFTYTGDGREWLFRTRGEFREMIHVLPQNEIVLMGKSIARIEADLRALGWELLAAGTGIIAVGLLGGWWLASRAIRPIAAISSAAEKIADGDLSKRIDATETKSELGALAGVLNHTFDRLQSAFDQQARFTADASHELRTPISVVLSQAELALSRQRTEEEYRSALAACMRSGERMKTLVDQLLELAKFDSGERKLFREHCDLAEVARECSEFLRPLAEEKKIKLTTSLQSVPAFVDGDRLHHAITNLLSNAIKHNPEGTETAISLIRQDGDAVLTVADNGTGIAAEDLPHLFERFYRADKARSRANGSTGLGLAIAKAFIEAHGGTITAASEPGKGSAFTVRLPAAQQDPADTGPSSR